MKYQIFGSEVQFIKITLDAEESVITESGTLMSMDNGIVLEPIMDTKNDKSVMGSLWQATKRVVTGDKIFMSKYTNKTTMPKELSVAPSFAGKIIPLSSKEVICQKGSFLVGQVPVDISVALTKNIGAGFFGAEGFILQRIKSDNQIFVLASGSVLERDLTPGEKIRLEPGCIVAFEPTVDFNVEVAELKNIALGNTDVFYSTLTGPGKIWLQSHPQSKFWDRVMKMMPKPTSKE
jgi:uncharacterized protein (TIGR00266 family)